MDTPSGNGIVVGIDGSDSALNAARWAGCLAQRIREPLRLVHVHELRREHRHEHERDREREREQGAEESGAMLAAATSAVREVADDIGIEPISSDGEPDRLLIDLSASARMIVLGHTTTTEWESMVQHSDVVSVSNHAVCPVVTWRSLDGFHPPDDRPILVGMDGTDLSIAAVEHAYAVAAALGAPLVAIHTWSEESTFTYGEASRFTDWTAYIDRMKAHMTDRLGRFAERYPDVEVSQRIEHGRPDIHLIDESPTAQLVVVGSHGRSAAAAAVLGSTSQGLIHHSSCPVMICRARSHGHHLTGA